MVIIGLN